MKKRIAPMLDLLTVVTYNAVVNFAVVVVATIAWIRSPRQKDMIYWVLAAWFMVLGAICTSMTEALPHNILAYLGGSIYVALTGFMRLGFKEFYGQPYRIGEAFVVSVFVCIGFGLAELTADPTSMRIMLIYVGSAANLALGAAVLWRGKPGEWLPSGRLASAIYAVYALANLMTAPLAILYPVQFIDRLPVSDWMAYTSMLLLIFNLLSFMMAMVLKLERSGEMQRRLAERDTLTGLLNRRVFLEQAAQLASRGATAIAVLDLDHFKRINDTYGHRAGDDALVQFSECLRKILPAQAIFGRLGGEEFGICLPGHDQASALGVIQALLSFLSTEEIRSGDNRFRLTFSCGVTVMDDPARSLDAWMADADSGLYAAKEEGRNRVVAHRGRPLPPEPGRGAPLAFA
ncbi:MULTISPECIES: GGDEF domain-containing protein [Rhizobium]|uniref:diguanylate cyclase n=1 Tax=Rhizobium straminoryzae TaxID=1387186 RepID=A0A549TB53_9HYPH|nr:MULTISPECIES: GGDEF domain-containing protein [Rhizobium]MBT9368922.1 GGDEF domain-containing protein [Rhizobium sp. CSW-27]TRL39111.1 GGDEF domain-containing protein [Rhizobium straminoryzae]